MLSHNVMPHCGENHPKNQETYESALINGHKYIKPVAELPRKCDENYVTDDIDETHSEKQRKLIQAHLDLPKPDLLNADRFADKVESPRMVKSMVVIKPATKPVDKPSAKPVPTVAKPSLPTRTIRPASSNEAKHREPNQNRKASTAGAEAAATKKKEHPLKKGKKPDPEAKHP